MSAVLGGEQRLLFCLVDAVRPVLEAFGQDACHAEQLRLRRATGRRGMRRRKDQDDSV
jgi:hypothetical protein